MRTMLPLSEVPASSFRIDPKGRTGLGAWVDEGLNKKPTKKRKATARSPRGYADACEQVIVMMRSMDWDGVKPEHLVGMYAVLHEQVYKVKPTELVDVWKGAVSAARAMLKKEFNDDIFAFIEYIRWTWQTERYQEAKRIAEGKEPFRITWGYQFKSRTKLTDYRVEMARAQEAAKPKGKR